MGEIEIMLGRWCEGGLGQQRDTERQCEKNRNEFLCSSGRPLAL